MLSSDTIAFCHSADPCGACAICCNTRASNASRSHLLRHATSLRVMMILIFFSSASRPRHRGLSCLTGGRVLGREPHPQDRNEEKEPCACGCTRQDVRHRNLQKARDGGICRRKKKKNTSHCTSTVQLSSN